MSKENINLKFYEDSNLILKKEIERIDKGIEFLNNKKEEVNSYFKIITDKTIEKEEKIQELQTAVDKLKGLKDEPAAYVYIKRLKNDIKEIRDKQIKDDKDTDRLGDAKTFLEKITLEFINYKRNCKELIETIESKIESPEDDKTTEEDIKNEFKKLNDEFELLFQDKETGKHYGIKYKNLILYFINHNYILENKSTK